MYPNSILPSLAYTHKIDLDTLLKIQQIFVVRRSDFPLEETFSAINLLTEKALDLNRIPNLSLNLLGAYFEIAHLKFQTKGDGSKNWDGKTAINISDYSDCFNEITSPFCAIFIDASAVHDQEIPYDRSLKDKMLVAKLREAGLLPTSSKEEDIELFGKIKIEHSPTNLNYWHVELKLIDFSGEPIKDSKSAWKTVFCQVVKDVLIVNAYPKLPDITGISSEVFAK